MARRAMKLHDTQTPPQQSPDFQQGPTSNTGSTYHTQQPHYQQSYNPTRADAVASSFAASAAASAAVATEAAALAGAQAAAQPSGMQQPNTAQHASRHAQASTCTGYLVVDMLVTFTLFALSPCWGVLCLLSVTVKACLMLLSPVLP